MSAVTTRMSERLEAVRRTELLDSPREEAFDRLTRLAAKLTAAPVTFISLVDESRDFYKSCYGFPEPLATKREMTGTTFCHYAIESPSPLVIEDTKADPVYRKVPTVESLGVRAYLGVPLVTTSGHAIGSFCAIDFKPRKWSSLDIEILQELAASTMREIDLREAMDTVRRERSLLDITLRQMPAGVMISDAEGRVLLHNDQATRITGSSLTDLRTASAGRAFTADGRPYAKEQWPLLRSIRDGEVVRDEIVTMNRADGTRVVLSISSTPVRDGDGKIVAGVVTLHDITELHEIAQENERLFADARRANEEKDAFFAAVSHELRTPMTAIMGWSRVLRMDVDTPDAIEAAEMIESSAALQAQLVDDLLDVTRIATGKVVLTKGRLDIDEVVDEAVRASEPMAAAKGVRLKVSRCEGADIEGDRGRLRQIFGNLLSNAVKFTPQGGLVEVETSQSDGEVTVLVRDTGRGIEPALLPRIFERGLQAHDAELGGLGLGLTIVRHLTGMHGGSVRAESEGAGKGATFVVRLPRASAAS